MQQGIAFEEELSGPNNCDSPAAVNRAAEQLHSRTSAKTLAWPMVAFLRWVSAG